jgi:hypothetical protein
MIRATFAAAVGGVTAAAVAVVVASYAHADTAIYVDGLTNSVPDAVAKLLVPPGYKFERLDYPAEAWPFTGLSSDTVGKSIAVGVPRLDQMIRAAVAAHDGPVVVAGVSIGAMVVEQEMRNLATRADAPTPSQVSFTLMADPTDPGGAFSYLPYTYIPVIDMVMQPFPQTPYKVDVIKQLYDGVSSFPDRPWNLLADLNALIGGLGIFHNAEHLAQDFALVEAGKFPPLDATTEVNAQSGVTTFYTGEFGGPALTHLFDPYLSNLDKLLTPIINLGYSSKTPNAGPHIAPGGALVNQDGQPVFSLEHGRRTIGKLTTAKSPAKTAHSDLMAAKARVGPSASTPTRAKSTRKHSDS